MCTKGMDMMSHCDLLRGDGNVVPIQDDDFYEGD
jgi:hypothetical protein